MAGLISKRFLVNVVAAVAVGLFGVPGADARDVGSYGGRGGGDFRSSCNPGDILIGFNMKTGSALDSIAPICIPSNPDGTWTGTAYEAPKYGGEGGTYEKLACREHQAVTSVDVYKGFDGLVNHIRITCRNLTEDLYHNHQPLNIGGQVASNLKLDCGPGEFGTAIYGRYGAMVDSLGLQCETMAFGVEAPPPAPPPPPAADPAAAAAANEARKQEIADERTVHGKTAEECVASHANCYARCKTDALTFGGPTMIAIESQCQAQQCEPFYAQCMANAAIDAGGGGGREPPGKMVKVLRSVTGYDKPDGNDKCYLEEGDTADLIESFADDPTWKHLKGTSGNCNRKEFWVFDQGELDL